MKKSIVALLLIVLLAGCSVPKSEHDSFLSDLPIGVTKSVVAQFVPQIEGYVIADYALLSTPASENGQGGLSVALRGVCTEVVNTDGGVWLRIAANEGDWICAVGMDDTSDINKASFILGQEVEVYATYLGVSSLLDNLPATVLENSNDAVIVDGVKHQYSDFLFDYLNEPHPLSKDWESLNDMVKSYNFAGIIDLLSAYVDTEKPIDNDVAFELLESAQLAKQLLSKCAVFEDDFDGSILVFYTGVVSISNEINVVPLLSGTSPMVMYGFRASNWVFFDKIRIKVGDTEIISDSFQDVKRDVVSGGVKEYKITPMRLDVAEKIIAYEAPVIRFMGDGGKMHEHALTESEMAAYRTIYELRNNVHFLSNTFYSWRDK